MRIVAINALSFLDGSMHPGFVQTYFLFWMALITGLISFLFKYQLGNDTVSEVTLLAFYFFDNGMYALHFEVFIRKLGVTLQTVLAYELSRLASMGGGTRN